MVSSLSESEIEALLTEANHAHLGCHANGKTLVVPINFAYDGKRVIGYTNDGLKTSMMRINPEVCVQIEEVKSLSEWKSVIVWGRYEELTGSEAAIAAGYLIDRYGPIFEASPTQSRRGRDVIPPKHDGQIGRAIVYCIHVGEKTGRFEYS